jgi:hypothetical protein
VTYRVSARVASASHRAANQTQPQVLRRAAHFAHRRHGGLRGGNSSW